MIIYNVNDKKEINEIKYIITFFIHSIFLLLTIFTGLLTNNKWILLLHFINWPITYIHWHFNKGACFLTNWENEYALGTRYEKINKDYPLFTQRFALLFGIKTKEYDNEVRIRILFTIGWIITCYKLYNLLYNK
jgi:hypothetical protein